MAITRRDLLSCTAGGCALAATGSLLPGCGFDVNAAPEVKATADSTGRITVALTAAAPLMNVGGAVILNVSSSTGGTVSGLPDGGILLCRFSSIKFVAVAAQCTHQGCPLGYSATENLIACPCHGSRFSATADSTKANCDIGSVVRGPAVAPLRNFDATYDPRLGTVTVNLTSPALCGSTVFIPTVTNGKVVLPFANIPDLANIGGTWTGQPQGLPDTLIVVRVSQTAVSVVSAVCTHQGCLVGYSAPSMRYVCPCHGSQFDLTGKVVQGPATVAVKQYTATVDTQAVTVTVA